VLGYWHDGQISVSAIQQVLDHLERNDWLRFAGLVAYNDESQATALQRTLSVAPDAHKATQFSQGLHVLDVASVRKGPCTVRQPFGYIQAKEYVFQVKTATHILIEIFGTGTDGIPHLGGQERSKSIPSSTATTLSLHPSSRSIFCRCWLKPAYLRRRGSNFSPSFRTLNLWKRCAPTTLLESKLSHSRCLMFETFGQDFHDQPTLTRLAEMVKELCLNEAQPQS